VLARKDGGQAVHQGVAALVAPIAYADAERPLRSATARAAGSPRRWTGRGSANLGAVIRTAAAAGRTGILLGTEDTVGITPAVAKTAAGALERIPIARSPSWAAPRT
jgi:23S rRNA (guanosine2251-2'-O)-methyltransferase